MCARQRPSRGLTADQVERVCRFGVVQRLPRGTVLYEPGARRADFFLVLDGFIEAYVSRGTTQQVVHVYGEQQFTGELNLFNDRAILVGGRMGGDGRVARLNGSQFRRLLAAEPDIANVVIRAFILRRERIFLHGHTGVTIIAPRHSAKSLQLQLFLTRNRQPYRLADPEVESGAAAQLSALGFVNDDTPVVLCGDDRVLVCPTPRELGDHIGISETLDPQHVADVVVVGAGPAGLAAAVYSASEGLDTVVLEADAPGGQASTSSRIENYLGFPIGISGRELAQRAQVQAQKFGARIIVPRTVLRLVTDSRPYVLELDDGTQVRAHTVVIATGARYRSLPLANIAQFEGLWRPLRRHRARIGAVRRRRRGRRWRGQLRRAGRGLPVTSGQPCAHPGARRRIWRPPCPTTSSVASRRRPNASPCIHTPRSPRSVASGTWTPLRGATGVPGSPRPAIFQMCFSCSGPRRTPSGSTAPSPWTTKDLCARVYRPSPMTRRPPTRYHNRWLPAVPAFSLSVTCDPDRSNGSPRPSARAR